MTRQSSLARTAVTISLAALILASLMLSGCGAEEVLRGRLMWEPRTGSALTWTGQSIGMQLNVNDRVMSLSAVSAADATHVWAVGNNGAILSLDGEGWRQGLVEQPNQWMGVSALDSNHVWAVGQEEENAGQPINEKRREYYAAISFYDGTNWHEQAGRTFMHTWLQGVFALGTRHVWAVGTHGTILFFDGSDWSKQSSGTQVELRGVSACDPEHVWAVGDKGTILFYDGSSWKKQDSGTGAGFMGVSAQTPAHVWAAGSDGVYFFDGSKWSKQAGETLEQFTASGIFALDPFHVWAVGGKQELGSTVAFFDGAAWSMQQVSDANVGLTGITAGDPSHVWAVGMAGVLMTGPVESPVILFGTDKP